MDHLIETFLRTRHGLPEDLDLTEFLKSPGTWKISGWKIFESDEVVLFYARQADPVILIIKRLAGGQSRPWVLPSFDQAAKTAEQYLTSTDMVRFHFGVQPYSNKF